MSTLNIYTDSLGFLVWPELYVPVRRLPDGRFQFFLHDDQIVKFNSQPLCLAFLRGVHKAEGGN